MTDSPLDPLHLAALAAADPKLAPLTRRFGHILYRRREGGFPALLRLIVEQQLSVKAADTITARLHAGLNGDLSPKALLAHDDDLMRGYGLSRPKISYARALAEALHTGAFDIEAIEAMPTEDAAKALIELKGIGRWTAEVYLMFSEGRLDLFPVGDVALREAVAWLDGLDARPDEAYSRTAPRSGRPIGRWRRISCGPGMALSAGARWNGY
ncbi:MAG: DNA-3-methyladenine glycosylase family protein [Asticcacaulis sp.]